MHCYYLALISTKLHVPFLFSDAKFGKIMSCVWLSIRLYSINDCTTDKESDVCAVIQDFASQISNLIVVDTL